MSIDTNLEDLVRRVVRDELATALANLYDRLENARPHRAPSATGDEEISTKEAAELAHVKPRTISEWRRRGLLTPVKRGRSHIFRVRDVLDVARQRGIGSKQILDYEQEASRILRKAG